MSHWEPAEIRVDMKENVDINKYLDIWLGKMSKNAEKLLEVLESRIIGTIQTKALVKK